MTSPAEARGRGPGGRTVAPHRVPRLHLVTDDAVVRGTGFLPLAADLMAVGGPDLALHLRAPHTGGALLHRLACALRQPAAETGALLVVNDRVDVALAAGADGVQLGARSLAAGDLPAAAAHLARGASVHSAPEAERAGAVDWLLVGTLWASSSHPGRRGAGLRRLEEVAAVHPAPLIGIGGITPARATEAVAAGAHGVAVLGGVWRDPEPDAALARYLSVFATDSR